MTPVTFGNPPGAGTTPASGSAAGGCFGWLHSREAVQSEFAILICPGLNRDALDAHHGLRLLADDLAAAGYPTLRFDYPGLGDSCDPPADAAGQVEHWSAWQHSVQSAADHLRRLTGAQKLLFCGLRFGATLAALGARARDDAAGLILLAPVLRGRSYMRQLQIEAQIQAGQPSDTPGGLDFHELHLSPETVGLISQADLRRVTLPAGLPVAIHSQTSLLLLTECIAQWEGGGAVVTAAGFDGLEPLLEHNLVEECAPPDFSAVLAWVRKAAPIGRRAPPTRHEPISSGPPAILLPPAVLLPPGCRETPLRFGPGGRLFGMLCEPDPPGVAAAPGAPAVIIGNTGRDPHYGFARFGTEFARNLAAVGIASLRIDFAGLGDSVGPRGRERMHTHMFEVDRGPDIAAAIAALERCGYPHVAVAGMCAGAYHGLHAALAEPRITALLLVNLPVFEWRPGDTVDFVNRRTTPPGPFLAKLARRATWRRLRRGEVHVSRFLLAQALRLRARAREVGWRALRRLGLEAPRSLAQTALAAFAGRGVRTLFVFAPEDSGLDSLELEFGPGATGLRAFAGAEIAVLPDIDHQLSTRAMRRAAADLMIQFLTRPKTLARPGARTGS